MFKLGSLLSTLLLVSACASNIPIEIREDISEEKVNLATVRSNIDRYVGTRVRWGGSIAAVQNKKNETWVELVGRPLGGFGEPNYYKDETQGRFIVRIKGFLDPDIYREGRRMTIYGVVEGRAEGYIDEHPYLYPLIQAGTHYLWDDYVSRQRYYYPHYYGYPYYYSPFSYHFGYYHWPYRRFGYGLHYRYW